MFATRKQTTLAAATFRFLELVYFGVVRSHRQTDGNAIIGLVKSMAQTVAMVMVFYVMLSLMGMRGMAVRGDYFLFLMSGVFLFMTHIKVITSIAMSEGPTSPMMQHAPMNTLVAILSAAIGSLYIQFLAVIVMLFIYHAAWQPILIDDVARAAQMVLLAWYTGIGVGLIVLALRPWLPGLSSSGMQLYTRINLFASGKMVVGNSLPFMMLPFFTWNPLFHIIDEARGAIFINYNPHFGAIRYVSEVLADRGIERGRIGVEEDYIPHALYRGFASVLSRFDLVDVSHGIMRQQCVKSDEEVAHIRAGAEVATLGAEAFEAALSEGAREIDVARQAVTAMEDEIARRFPEVEQDGTFSWCQFGTEHTYVAHNPNTTRTLQPDELISLNVFPMIAGYYHLLERSIFVGDMPDEVRKPFEVCSEAHEAGIAAVRPGVRCNQIDDHVDPVFEKAGYLQDRTFGTGHSFGIMGQWYGRDEIGELRPYNDTVLEKNMVISIEPMISVPGIGGFRHADMLLVTDDGAEVLTTYRRGVIVI